MKKIVKFMNLDLIMGIKEKIALERELGTSPLVALFGMMGADGEEIDFEKIPTVDVMVAVLFHASQKLNHGISREKMFEIIDSYLEVDEHSVMDLIAIVVEVLQVSKYLPSVEE